MSTDQINWFDDNATLLTRVAWFVKNTLPSFMSAGFPWGDQFISLTRCQIVPITILRGLNQTAIEVDKAFLVDPMSGMPLGELDFWKQTEHGMIRPGVRDKQVHTVVRDMVRSVLFELKYSSCTVQLAVCKDKIYLVKVEYSR